jgi:small-conductance mechanosensitive channel
MKSVFERFNKEGIEVPFPYRTIVYKKDIEEQK